MNNAQAIALRIVFFAAAAVTGLKLGIFLMGPRHAAGRGGAPGTTQSASLDPARPERPKEGVRLAAPSAALPPIAPWQAVEADPDAAAAAVPDRRPERKSARKPARLPTRVTLHKPEHLLLAVPEVNAPPAAVEPECRRANPRVRPSMADTTAMPLRPPTPPRRPKRRRAGDRRRSS